MLYNEQSVRDNIRNRNGKRVFFLGAKDNLTPSARDWLQSQRIEILPVSQIKGELYRSSNGDTLKEKPEEMTHLRGTFLVPKTHPIISFRGAMDTLQAELLLTQLEVAPQIRSQVEEILMLARNILRWEVMEEPADEGTLCGLTLSEQRSQSHRPQDYYGQPHFMPSFTDGREILQLNRARCAARAAELAAAVAFSDATTGCTRPDILRLLNRMSSMLYILMIRQKAALNKGENHGSFSNSSSD